jgi:iron(III) transport system substrate-binding protein
MRGAKLLVSTVGLLMWLGLSAHAAEAKTDLWIYTSVYKEFIAPIAHAFELKNPDIQVQVFQGGSEKIQAKVEAEVVAQRPQADVVMISDPFWGYQLAKRDLLYTRKGHPSFEPNYISLMVMITHKNVPVDQRPTRWTDLTDPKFHRKVQMGSPLESGTMFAAVAYLSDKLGWDYFDKLGQNVIGSNGGNSAVIQKVESGEKKFGMVLLENALAAKNRGSPIEIIYPADGGIPIESVQLILKASSHLPQAEKFCDFVLSPEGQQLLRAGYMYPINPKIPGPADALPYSQATQGTKLLTPAKIEDISIHSKDIKKKFAELVLE